MAQFIFYRYTNFNSETPLKFMYPKGRLVHRKHMYLQPPTRDMGMIDTRRVTEDNL